MNDRPGPRSFEGQLRLDERREKLPRSELAKLAQPIIPKWLLDPVGTAKSDPLAPIARAYVEAFKSGKRYLAEAAATQLYAKLSPRLYSFLRSQGLNETQADDCLQEVAIRFFRGLESFKGTGTVAAYAFTITRNELIRTGGLLGRLKALFVPLAENFMDDEIAFDLHAEPPMVPSEQEAAQRECALEKALERLKLENELWWYVVTQINYAELKPAVVAKQLGITREEVYSAHYRGKKRLMVLFSEE